MRRTLIGLAARVRVVERGGIPQVQVVVPEVRMRNLASIAKAGAGLPSGMANALSSGVGRLARFRGSP